MDLAKFLSTKYAPTGVCSCEQAIVKLSHKISNLAPGDT